MLILLIFFLLPVDIASNSCQDSFGSYLMFLTNFYFLIDQVRCNDDPSDAMTIDLLVFKEKNKKKTSIMLVKTNLDA